MMKLFEPLSGVLSVPYEPNATTKLLENPPRFTWMPARLDNDSYMLQFSSSPDFEDSETTTVYSIPYNLYTPSEPLAPGVYYWRYALADAGSEGPGDRWTDWSEIRSFMMPQALPETPLPARADRYADCGVSHPRLWMNLDGLTALRENVQANPAYCGWDSFMDGSVKPWLDHAFIAEPARYPDNKRTAPLWRQMYMDCQETFYAIRHLGVAGVVLQDADLLARAKEWLLHVASWDVDGTTSRDYNDEAAFRITGALAWGYDWLHGELTPEERDTVQGALLGRTRQVASHVIERSKIHQVPFDSHAVRSLSSVLVPACIAMLHEEPEAREWLDYTLEYYACLYSPWGGEDGGWAEGPLYWTTGMAFMIDALNLVKNYCGLDLFKRPFFGKTGDFPLYCSSPDTIRASFGDQSYLGEPASLKCGFNIRHFAGVTGNGLYQWYFEQARRNDPDPDSKFYNYGWWDFRFDELLYRSQYPQVEPLVPTDERIEPVKWFRDIGWVAMHRRMDDPKEHVMLLTKSSRYGSVSHSHGDQNAFLLHAFGEPLAIESGYYIAFGSTMHKNWRRQTQSTNSILIDGKGQYAGDNKALCMEASGKVLKAESGKDYGYCRSDATAAYLEHVPYLNRYEREIYFFNGSYVVIVDYVDLSRPASVDWLMHTLYPMEVSEQAFRVNGLKADMDVRFVYSSSGLLSLRQHHDFKDVAADELVGLDDQWHMHASTRESASHRLVSLLVPMKKGESKYVSYFLDDQDHGVHVYFTNEEGKTQKIEVEKAY